MQVKSSLSRKDLSARFVRTAEMKVIAYALSDYKRKSEKATILRAKYCPQSVSFKNSQAKTDFSSITSPAILNSSVFLKNWRI